MKVILLSAMFYTLSIPFSKFEKADVFKNNVEQGYSFCGSEKKSSIDTSKTEYNITEAGLYIKLPNAHWHRTPSPKGNPIQYMFKRDEIIDSKGMAIVPAISVWFDVVNKAKYHGDLDIYKEQKITAVMNAGVDIRKTIPAWAKKEGYPLNFKKGIFHQGVYSRDGLEHIYYVMYFINKRNIGFTVSMDMTKDIAAKYESEFWITIRSLRDL